MGFLNDIDLFIYLPVYYILFCMLVAGKLVHADLDERALDALKEFPANDALNVLSQFLESNLEHVSNKSAYLCGIMKTYRQQKGRGGSGISAANSVGSATKGPDDEKIKVSQNLH